MTEHFKSNNEYVVNTYYTVSAENDAGDLFKITIREFDSITLDKTPQELAQAIKNIWKSRTTCNLDGVTIVPKGQFEIYDETGLVETYVLESSKKQTRSKFVDYELKIGEKYNPKEIICWKEEA